MAIHHRQGNLFALSVQAILLRGGQGHNLYQVRMYCVVGKRRVLILDSMSTTEATKALDPGLDDAATIILTNQRILSGS